MITDNGKKLTVRIAALLLAAAVMTAVFCTGTTAIAEPVIVNADTALIYNINNDRLMFSQNYEKVIYPAATVKLMTAIIAIEYFRDDPDKTVTVPIAATVNVGGNSISLKPGERIRADSLIAGLIVGGANDAAVALAIIIGGSVEGFAAMMNAKARELGALDTNYTNATGLHDAKMYTTPADILKVALYAYHLTQYMECCGEQILTLPATALTAERKVINRNYFISTNIESKYYYSIVNGMNAGSTVEGGYCVVATAHNDGLTYLSIVTGAVRDATTLTEGYETTDESGEAVTVAPTYEYTYHSYVEARKLIDWAISSYGYVRIVDASSMICEIPLLMSAEADHVSLLPERSIDLYLPTDTDVETDIIMKTELISDTLTAPVTAGQVAGVLKLYYRDEQVGEVNLLVRNNVEKSRLLGVWQTVSGAVFRWSNLFWLVILIAVYAVSVSVYRYRKRQNYIKQERLKHGKQY